MVALMSDSNDHNDPSSFLLRGYLTDAEAAAQRRKSRRALRDERQRGAGPPYTLDGRRVLYPVEGFRDWLRSNVRQPVRGPAKVA
jgi:hypothetical protein